MLQYCGLQILDNPGIDTQFQNSEQELNNQLRNIREYSADRMWKGLLVVALGGAPVSVSRATFTGWLPLYTLHLLLALFVTIIYFFSPRLSHQLKSWIMVMLFWGVGLPGVFSFGLSASSLLWLVLSSFVASSILSVRTGIYVAFAVVVLYCLLAIAYVSGFFVLSVDMNLYTSEVTSWATMLVGTGTFIYFVLQTNVTYLRSITDLLRQVSDNRVEIARLANYDNLTGLPVMRLAEERINLMLSKAQRTKETIALLFIDLDGFKEVNDTWGHAVGDLLLVEVAKRLSSSLRKADTVARFAGDEFLIALGNVPDAATAENMASNLISTISEPVELNGNQIQVGASIGISFYPDDATDLKNLLILADLAMYDAKQSGKHCISRAQAPRGSHATRT